MFLFPPGLDLCEAVLQPPSGPGRRLKPVAAQCAISVKRISSKDVAIANRLDVSLSPYLKEGVFSSAAKPGVYLRDLFDTMPTAKPLPFMSFLGTIFLSPLSVTLPSLDRRKSVIVRLEFRQSDDEAVTVPLKSLFTSTGAVKVREIYLRFSS